MSEGEPSGSRDIARSYLDRGDGQGWFDELYRLAAGDENLVPWADQRANPLMEQLLDHHFSGFTGNCAVVGCGLGDDAEELARRGLAVTAFDLSATAVDWCLQRFPDSPVDYRQADLLALPDDMHHAFDLVVEINTLQAVPDALRLRMFSPLAGLLRPGGYLLLICRRREEGEAIDGPPWALSRSELEIFSSDHGLENVRLESIVDGEDPPRRRFAALFRRRERPIADPAGI